MKKFRFYAMLIAMVTFVACSDDDVETPDKNKDPEFAGYWILSEGSAEQGNAELAWYDATEDKLDEKQFSAINGKPLGDTANKLKIYGSKMYIVVTGGFGTETSKENSYIQVVNPNDGTAIKRIPFTDVEGTPAKPRNIIFEGAYGYITSYSNEVVRIDTATLTLDKHVALGGIMAEGLTFKNGKLYVCNGGQGADSTISVIDIKQMKEIDLIKTVKNPGHIVATSNGDIYFNTDWLEYKLYKLTTDDKGYTEVPGINVADMVYSNNNIYSCMYNWDSSVGEIKQFNTKTETVTSINLNYESEGVTSLVEYHIGAINNSDLLYITGMYSDDVVIFDPTTQKIKHTFKTGTPAGNSVVAVYK